MDVESSTRSLPILSGPYQINTSYKGYRFWIDGFWGLFGCVRGCGVGLLLLDGCTLILLDDGLAESLIVSQMGHANIKTTKEHYYKNRRNADQITSELDKVTTL